MGMRILRVLDGVAVIPQPIDHVPRRLSRPRFEAQASVPEYPETVVQQHVLRVQ